jgi:hypothetical protein
MLDAAPDEETLLLAQVPAFDPVALAHTTPHPLDASIQFEEEAHLYRCQFEPGGPFEEEGIISASTVIHSHFPHFAPDLVIEKMRRGKKWTSSKYFGRTPAEIKAQWEDNGRRASARGTRLHFLLECHNNGYDLQSSVYRDLPDVQAYFRWRAEFFDARQLVPFRTELRMRTGAKTRMTGTADLLAVARDHPPPQETGGCLTLHVIDWKFSRCITRTNYFEKGSGPCASLDNCNYAHYLLQQNLYQWMLETFYGTWVYGGQTYTSVRVGSKHLAIFHPNHPDGRLYLTLPDCRPIILDIVRAQQQKVAAGTLPALPALPALPLCLPGQCDPRRKRPREEPLLDDGGGAWEDLVPL